MPRFKSTVKSIGRQVRQQTPFAKTPPRATTGLDKNLSRILNLPVSPRKTSEGKMEVIPSVGVRFRFSDLPGEKGFIKKAKEQEARGVGSTPTRVKR